MEMRNIILIFSVLFVGLTGSIYAQTAFLDVQKTDNSSKKIDLNSLNKITFTTTDLVLNYFTNESENIAKKDIQKMFFTKTTGLSSLVSDNKLLEVYPNPAIDFIRLKNIQDGNYLVNIYSITGSKIKSQMITSNETEINISNLSKGLYILKVNNQVSKFTKQ